MRMEVRDPPRPSLRSGHPSEEGKSAATLGFWGLGSLGNRKGGVGNTYAKGDEHPATQLLPEHLEHSLRNEEAAGDVDGADENGYCAQHSSRTHAAV